MDNSTCLARDWPVAMSPCSTDRFSEDARKYNIIDEIRKTGRAIKKRFPKRIFFLIGHWRTEDFKSFMLKSIGHLGHAAGVSQPR